MSPELRRSPTISPLLSLERRRTRHLTPAILMLLRDGPLHGYALMQELPTLLARAEDRPSASVFYRTLKKLSAQGSVRLRVVEEQGVPRRKLYELTDEGVRILESWLALLEADLRTISTLLGASGRGSVTPTQPAGCPPCQEAAD